MDAGNFKEEIVPLTVEETPVNSENTSETTCSVFDTDEGPRRDTSPRSIGIPETCF